jgi:organic hydroperoxide reductase OsmC/OhrA
MGAREVANPERPFQRQPAQSRSRRRQSLVEEAEQLCPYSKATRGNIDVAFNLL